jgi:hypothetical protein
MHKWRYHVLLTSRIIWADEMVEVEVVCLGGVLLYVHGVEDTVRPDDIIPRSAHHAAVLATLPPQPRHAQRPGGGGVGCAHLIPADKSRLHLLAGLVEAAEEEAQLAEPGLSIISPGNATTVLMCFLILARTQHVGRQPTMFVITAAQKIPRSKKAGRNYTPVKDVDMYLMATLSKRLPRDPA